MELAFLRNFRTQDSGLLNSSLLHTLPHTADVSPCLCGYEYEYEGIKPLRGTAVRVLVLFVIRTRHSVRRKVSAGLLAVVVVVSCLYGSYHRLPGWAARVQVR
eukprot:scaffold8200_cov29-Prasinocladus_malaysianus.AAC.1